MTIHCMMLCIDESSAVAAAVNTWKNVGVGPYDRVATIRVLATHTRTCTTGAGVVMLGIMRRRRIDGYQPQHGWLIYNGYTYGECERRQNGEWAVHNWNRCNRTSCQRHTHDYYVVVITIDIVIVGASLDITCNWHKSGSWVTRWMTDVLMTITRISTCSTPFIDDIILQCTLWTNKWTTNDIIIVIMIVTIKCAVRGW